MRTLERWLGYLSALLTTNRATSTHLSAPYFHDGRWHHRLEKKPTMNDMTAVVWGMPNWKAVEPDSIPAELLQPNHPGFIRYLHSLVAIV